MGRICGCEDLAANQDPGQIQRQRAVYRLGNNIQEKYPALLPLYQDIYNQGSRSYWETLDTELQEYAAEIGLDYVTNDDRMSRPLDDPPIVVNYFYHEQIKKSAQKGRMANA